MTDPSVSGLVPKRAADLVVGDRIPESQLIYKFNKGPAEVVFLADEPEDSHTFLAYRYPNRRHESMTVRSEAVLDVYPADTGLSYSRADDGETTQPIAGRVPAQFGAVTGASLAPEPIAEHYDASDVGGADCACGKWFGDAESLRRHIEVAATRPTVVSEGGHMVVEVAGGLIEIDPPEGFVGSMLTVDDLPCESRGPGHLPHDGHVYECCGKVGRISRHKPSCPIFGAGPASAD